jgi:hypothetical protein
MTKSLTVAWALVLMTSASPAVAPAHADDGDPVGFIKSLDNDGVPYRDSFDALHFGYVSCHMIDQGNTPAQLANAAIAHGTTYTPRQLHLLIGDAIAFLCPQHLDDIPESWS